MIGLSSIGIETALQNLSAVAIGGRCFPIDSRQVAFQGTTDGKETH
jgi:hypothetical protein